MLTPTPFAVITDPEDPKFDLEAYLKAKAEEKIEDIDGRIRGLRRMRGALVEITKTCSGTGATSECPILEYMAKERR